LTHSTEKLQEAEDGKARKEKEKVKAVYDELAGKRMGIKEKYDALVVKDNEGKLTDQDVVDLGKY
jgi:hypothetical protein